MSSARGRYGTAVAVLAGATAGLLVVLYLGGGFDSSDPDASGVSGPSAPTAPPDPEASPAPSVLAPLGSATAPVPTGSGLAAALAGPLGADALGPRVSMVVVDPADGSTLFSQDATRAMVPASTVKLVTAASVLHLVGGEATADTRVVAGARDGEIVLVGGGDPTLTLDGTDGYPGSASLTELAEQTAAALAAAGTTRVRLVLDDTLFSGPRTGPGWPQGDLATGLVWRVSALTLDDPDPVPGAPGPADPTGTAGRAFRAALVDAGVEVTGTGRGAAAPGAEQLASVSSPPMAALVEQMLLTSDNDVAEALAHLAGVAGGTGGSFAGGVAAAEATLTWLGLDPTAVQLVDGSGISPLDRARADVLGGVVAAGARGDRPELAPLLSGLPVAGVSGSLSERFDGPATDPARGRVRAKTGTLTGVNALAGTVLDADGRVLVFVTLADRTTFDTEVARAALDRVAATLEACGCR